MTVEVKTTHFWRGVFAELLATTIFVLISCGATLPLQGSVSVEQQAWAFGLTMTCVVQCIGYCSGGHVNPAVTGAYVFTGKITWLRALFYIVAQTAGGIAGAAILYAITPSELRGSLGQTVIHDDVTIAQAIGVEALLTFLVVLTVFASNDTTRKTNDYGTPPLIIGLAYTAAHFVGISYTGCSVNPVRSLGPAIIMNEYKYQWIFWTAPMLAGIFAGLVYELLLCTRVEARAYQLSPRVCNLNCCSVNESDNVKQEAFVGADTTRSKYTKRDNDFDDILNFNNAGSGGMYQI